MVDRGKRRHLKNVLLEKWSPELGCFHREAYAKEAWVRVVGLPLHLRSREVFKKIGDECGGSLLVDEDVTSYSEL